MAKSGGSYLQSPNKSVYNFYGLFACSGPPVLMLCKFFLLGKLAKPGIEEATHCYITQPEVVQVDASDHVAVLQVEATRRARSLRLSLCQCRL